MHELHIIEMPKAKKIYRKNPQDILAQWILFILDPNETEVQSLMSKNEELKRTNEKLENISEDEDVRKKAEILARWQIEEKWNRQSVYEHGKEEGLKEGENKEKIQIAMKLLKNNISINIIAQSTDLPEEEIRKLQEQIK